MLPVFFVDLSRHELSLQPNFFSYLWYQMPLGRQCVDHYRMLHRYNVFSHDEMVCNMALKADTLDMVLASAVHKDMVVMIREEQELREKVKKMVG